MSNDSNLISANGAKKTVFLMEDGLVPPNSISFWLGTPFTNHRTGSVTRYAKIQQLLCLFQIKTNTFLNSIFNIFNLVNKLWTKKNNGRLFIYLLIFYGSPSAPWWTTLWKQPLFLVPMLTASVCECKYFSSCLFISVCKIPAYWLWLKCNWLSSTFDPLQTPQLHTKTCK